MNGSSRHRTSEITHSFGPEADVAFGMLAIMLLVVGLLIMVRDEAVARGDAASGELQSCNQSRDDERKQQTEAMEQAKNDLLEAGKENEKLKNGLQVAADTQRACNDQVTDTNAELAGLRGKVEHYRNSPLVLRDVGNARLVIEIEALTLPAEPKMDIDLYVEPPNNKVCWFNDPALAADGNATGTLITSEGLNLRSGYQREVFYTNAVYSDTEPYLVGVMVYCPNGGMHSETISIQWRIMLRDEAGRVCDEMARGYSVARVGKVGQRGSTFVFQNIERVLAFRIRDYCKIEETEWVRAANGNDNITFRNWSKSDESLFQNAKTFIKDGYPK